MFRSNLQGEEIWKGDFYFSENCVKAALPQALNFLQYIGTRVGVSHSFDVTTESVRVGDLSSSPSRHHSSSFREAQTQILSLSQTNWPEIFFSPDYFSLPNVHLM